MPTSNPANNPTNNQLLIFNLNTQKNKATKTPNSTQYLAFSPNKTIL